MTEVTDELSARSCDPPHPYTKNAPTAQKFSDQRCKWTFATVSARHDPCRDAVIRTLSGVKQTRLAHEPYGADDPEETFTLSESGNVFPLDSTAAEGIVRQLLKIDPLAGKGGRDPPTRHYLAVPYPGLDSIVPFTA